MDIDRRSLLVGIGSLGLTGFWGQDRKPPTTGPTDSSLTSRWHPLTRSLLDRAIAGGRPDRHRVERAVRELADAQGHAARPVIKWMESPTDAFEHLSRHGLDALLDMESASFWRRARPPASPDEETYELAFEVRMLANEILGVESHDRALMAPKLLAKSQAMSANLSDKEAFRVRAVSAQIGWLETSLAEATAQAISNIELLLRTGASEGSMAIDHQLMVFESYEHGLVATWETPGALICMLQA